MTWTLPLPWVAPPLTGNDRGDKWKRARKTDEALKAARYAVRAVKRRAALDPEARYISTLHWRVPNRVRRDADNIAATQKVVQDALVREGVLSDDNATVIPETRQRIHPPSDEGPAMWLTLEGLP